MTQRRFTFRWILIACAILGSFAIPSNADAAGLLDWLFPRRAERVQRRLQRRLARVDGTGNRITTNFRAFGGANGTGTVPGTWNGWSQIPANQAPALTGTTAGFAPTTSYRTVWSPVPVTTYQVGTNGCQTPCTSYSWQARRVPYTTFQPTTGTTGFANVAPTLPGGCATCDSGSGTTAFSPTLASNANGNTVNYGSDWSWASSGNSGWNTVETGRPRFPNGSPYASAASNVRAFTPTAERTVVDTQNATQWAPVQSAVTSPAAASGSGTRSAFNPQSSVGDGGWAPVQSATAASGGSADGGWVPAQSGTASTAGSATRAGYEQTIQPTPNATASSAGEWQPVGADRRPALGAGTSGNGGSSEWVPQTRYDLPATAGNRTRTGYAPIPPARTRTGYRADEVDEEPRFTAAEWREIQDMRQARERERRELMARESERQDYLDRVEQDRLDRERIERQRLRDQAGYDRYGYDQLKQAEYRDEVRDRNGFRNSVYRAPRAVPERDTEGGWSYDRVNKSSAGSGSRTESRYAPVPSTTAPIIPRRDVYQPRSSYPSRRLQPIPEPRNSDGWNPDRLIKLSRPVGSKVSLASLERWEAKPISAKTPARSSKPVQSDWRSVK